MEKIKALFSHIKIVEHRAIARVAAGTHFAYYTLVGMEAHGSYRYAAGILCGLMVFEVILGKEVEK